MNRNKNTAHVDSQTSERYFQFIFTKSHNGFCITYYVTTDPGGSPGWQTILFFGIQIKFTFIDRGTTGPRTAAAVRFTVQLVGRVFCNRSVSFIEKKNVSFLLQTDKIIIDPKSISRLKANKKRFQPATCFNKKTAALRVFELE